MHYKIPLVLEPQEEGGFTVTSPALPELLTEGDTAPEALGNVQDTLDAVLELNEDMGRKLPEGLRISSPKAPVHLDAMVEAS